MNSKPDKRPGRVISKEAPTNAASKLIQPKPGTAFSALVNSMLPLDLIINLESHHESLVYDEFGFKISTEIETYDVKDSNGVKRVKNGLKFTQPFVEDSKHKLKWIAYLEFNVDKMSNDQFSLNNEKILDKCERLKNLIRSQGKWSFRVHTDSCGLLIFCFRYQQAYHIRFVRIHGYG
jgi:hypothetical protein